MRTVLITSGAYIAPELIAEFGRLPPSFLPVGNRRLFALQFRELHGHAESIYISLPEGFDIPVMDRALMDELGIKILFVPQKAGLSESVAYCMDTIGSLGSQFSILHGDTLIFDYPYGVVDSVSIGNATEYYNWAVAKRSGSVITHISDSLPSTQEDAVILTGFFSFADPALFRKCLTADSPAQMNSFVAALDHYTQLRPLRGIDGTGWLDFGHMHTYFSSRCQITTQRAFNALSVSNRRLTKSSLKRDRIDAEANWYEQLPAKMRIFCPHYMGRIESESGPAYELEYLYLSSLSDLLVFGALPTLMWEKIFHSCSEFLVSCQQYPAESISGETAMEMYLDKTMVRLSEFVTANGIDINASWSLNGKAIPSLKTIAREAAARISTPADRHLMLLHGDFCCSNILYDFRTSSIRVIDPRGQDAKGVPSIYGDQRYDLAKLYHSIHGLYDFIMAGYYRIQQDGPYNLAFSLMTPGNLSDVQHAFDRTIDSHFAPDKEAAKAINILLFLSMLPLHHDDKARQQALMANALRLYTELDA